MKRRLYHITAFALFAMLASARAGADDGHKIDLIIPHMPQNIAEDNKSLGGSHGTVVKQILDLSKLAYRISSPSHAYSAFYDGQYHCITPDSKQYYAADSNYIDSMPIHQTSWMVVQRKGTDPIEGTTGLYGKLIGSMFEQSALAFLPDDIQYDVSPDMIFNLRKVSKKRLDVAIIPHSGLEKTLKDNPEFNNLSYTISKPLAVIKDAIMCHDDKHGRAVIKEVNSIIENFLTPAAQ